MMTTLNVPQVSGGPNLGRFRGNDQESGLLGSLAPGKEKTSTKEQGKESMKIGTILKRIGRALLIFIMPCGGSDVEDLFSENDRK
ncbi:hypothetical protein [Magnetospira sp. QH-2]|uniref:hypothetical protein n=1 Tax=Magnetospira sp. (strain QH-2) TaxID=1288970 RepID=UPI0005F9FB1F|nr:hypothetical protein [Magnetospira sp. QH-2]